MNQHSSKFEKELQEVVKSSYLLYGVSDPWMRILMNVDTNGPMGERKNSTYIQNILGLLVCCKRLNTNSWSNEQHRRVIKELKNEWYEVQGEWYKVAT